MLAINTNIPNLVLQRHFAKTNVGLNTSLERLSSGFRINHAADDAANMAVSERMQSQILGSKVAIDNASHGLGFMTIADTTLGNFTEMAQRIRELSIQSMNGTYSDAERAMMQAEVEELTKELYRQRNATKFNSVNIFGLEEEIPVPNDTGDDDTDTTPKVEPEIGSPLIPSGPTGTPGTKSTGRISEDEARALGYNIIKTAEDFKNMNISQKNILMANINFNEISGWTTKNLTGELNGNGYSINNYNASTSLFGSVDGTVKNLTLNNVKITATSSCGALATTIKGTVDNCSISGDVTGTSSVGGLSGTATSVAKITNCKFSGNVKGSGNYTGGLIGNSQATITNCSTSGSVTSTGNYTGGLVGNSSKAINNSTSSSTVNGKGYVGGFAGASSSSITNCSASGYTEGTADSVGGLVGYNTSTITSSKASGNVLGQKNNIGGFVGNNTNGKIDKCSASGNVTGNGSFGGGFIGYCSGGTVSLSSATGKVVSHGTSCYGGLIGHLFNKAAVTECYATGDVQGNSSGQYGGLIGHIFSNATVKDSYSTGNVIGNDAIGGCIGLADNAIIENCYSTGNADSENAYAGGFIGKYNSGVHISNCYSKGSVTSRNGGAFSSGAGSVNFVNCYANAQQPDGVRKEQTGVTGENRIWFEDNSNLTFLGSKFDLTSDVNPPQITNNQRYVPPPPPPPPPVYHDIELQIGANSDEYNVLTIGTEFYFNNYYGDVSTVEKARETLNKTDNLISRLISQRAKAGAMMNRLGCVEDSLDVQVTNTSASLSRILDTDFAKETSNLVRNQILQSATAAIFSQTHSTASIALQLLK